MPPGKLRGNGRFLGFGYALVSASDRTLWGWTRELKTEKTAGSAAGGALQTASRLVAPPGELTNFGLIQEFRFPPRV